MTMESAPYLEVQRAHLEEYRRVTQAHHIRMYRRFVLVAGVLIAGLTANAVWLTRLIL